MHRFRQIYLLILLLLAVVALAVLVHGQQLSKRLILKDGSYQPVTKYEIKGERVRYYSAERFEWEEVPKSLVDWPATEKFNKQREAGISPPLSEEARQVSAEELAERQAEAARSPEVAPGLRLPPTGGVFLLDTWRDQPELIELVQNGADLNKQTGSNILRATINPLAKKKQTMELKGLNARVQAHVQQPVVYLNIEPDENAKPNEQPSYRIVRAQQKTKDKKRVVGALKIGLTGKVKEEASAVPTSVEPVSGGWVKIAPTVALQPGEYAVVEMLGEQINMFVWDFGVNPSAPENQGTWRPVQPARSPGAGPVLNGPRK
jgi:hypothetical protein